MYRQLPEQSIMGNRRERSNVYALLTGNILEVTIFPEEQTTGQDRSKGSGTPKEAESEESILHRSVSRARKKIRNAVNANDLHFLCTLTYAVSHLKYYRGEKPLVLRPIDWTKDREKVIEDWRRFARKMRKYERKRGENFRYVALIELHTGKRAKDTTIKTGTYHIHFCTDKEYDKRLLKSKWTHGLCNCSDWSKGARSQDLADDYDTPAPDNPGAYMSKYTGKDFESQNTRGKKRYWIAEGLNKPIRLSVSDLARHMHGAVEIWNNESEEILKNPYAVIKRTYKVDDSMAGNTEDRNTRRKKHHYRGTCIFAWNKAISEAKEARKKHDEESGIDRITAKSERCRKSSQAIVERYFAIERSARESIKLPQVSLRRYIQSDNKRIFVSQGLKSSHTTKFRAFRNYLWRRKGFFPVRFTSYRTNE